MPVLVGNGLIELRQICRLRALAYVCDMLPTPFRKRTFRSGSMSHNTHLFVMRFRKFPSLAERLHPTPGNIGKAKDVRMDAAPMSGTLKTSHDSCSSWMRLLCLISCLLPDGPSNGSGQTLSYLWVAFMLLSSSMSVKSVRRI